MALPVTKCDSRRVYAHCVEPHAGQRLLPLESRKFKQGPPRHSGIQEATISFPQDVADLKNLQHFFSSLGENDVVNVRVRASDADDEEAPTTLRRARVIRLLPEGIQVQLDDIEGTEPESRLVFFETY